MPSSKSSVDKRDVYYRKGKSDGKYPEACAVEKLLLVNAWGIESQRPTKVNPWLIVQDIERGQRTSCYILVSVQAHAAGIE